MGGNNENVWWNTKYKGFYSYGLSPFYQKSIFPHIGKDLNHLAKAIVKHGMSLGPFILAGALTIYYAKEKYRGMHRKVALNVADSLSIKELTHSLRTTT